MSDDRHEGLSPSARALLQQAGGPRARTAAERARTAQAVGRIAATPVTVGLGWLSWKGALLAAALVAVSAGVAVARRERAADPAQVAPRAAEVPAPPRADAGVAPPARIPERVSLAVTAPRAAAPRVVRGRRAAIAPTVAAAPAAPVIVVVVVGGGSGGAVARSPEDEQRALERARGLLRSDPGEALRVAEEAPPAGSRLAEERELIALEALQRLGRAEALRTRAERFLRRFPRSLYAERVRRWVAPRGVP
jgi:hypothetical protein